MIRLPVPPSTNNLFATVGKFRRKTQEYKTWQTEAGWELNIQRAQPVEGAAKLNVWLPYLSRRDGDNFLKPIQDLLVAHGLIEDDSLRILRDVHIRVHDEDFVGIELEPLSSPVLSVENRTKAAGVIA